MSANLFPSLKSKLVTIMNHWNGLPKEIKEYVSLSTDCCKSAY